MGEDDVAGGGWVWHILSSLDEGKAGVEQAEAEAARDQVPGGADPQDGGQAGRAQAPDRGPEEAALRTRPRLHPHALAEDRQDHRAPQELRQAGARGAEAGARAVRHQPEEGHWQQGLRGLRQLKQEKEQEEERNPTSIATFFKKEEIAAVRPLPVENNFFKARMDVTALIKQKTLQEFLEENFIQEYLPLLTQAGLADLEALRYVTREQLAELGVKAGHQVKIIKKIREEFDKQLKKEEPAELPQQSSLKVEYGYGDGDVNSYQPEPAEDNPRAQEESEEEEQEEERDEVLITAPMQEMSLQAEQAGVNCYECYRPVVSEHYHHDEKYFCSELCMDRYLSLLRKSCPACGAIFLKTEGFREEGLWFCSLGCCPNHQQIEELFFGWHRGA